MSDVQPLLEQSVEINADRATVWSLVSDVSRMPEWSAGVTGVRYKGDGPHPQLGSEFTNRNELGELVWVTHGQITAFDEDERLTWRIKENWAVWSLHLADAGDGRTLLTQRSETPEGISEISHELTDGFMGGQEQFQAQLLDSMAATLDGIRAAAESA